MGIRCPVCGWTFGSESKMLGHLNAYHPEYEPSASPAEAAGADDPEKPTWQPSAAVSTPVLVAGWIGAIIFPILGLVVAIYLLTKRVYRQAIPMLAVTIAIGVAAALWLPTGDDGPGSFDPSAKADRILDASQKCTRVALDGNHALQRCIHDAIH